MLWYCPGKSPTCLKLPLPCGRETATTWRWCQRPGEEKLSCADTLTLATAFVLLQSALFRNGALFFDTPKRGY